MKKLIFNHKSYLLLNDVVKYIDEYKKINFSGYECILFPQLIYLPLFNDVDCKLGAQNFYSSNMGSFTGEVNLESLKSLGVKYLMISQYERNRILGESKGESRDKLYKALDSKFNTLLCLGEERRLSKPFYSIKSKINYFLKNIDKSKLNKLSIVYEPSYSIGCADIKDVKYLSNIILGIKRYIKNRYGISVDVYYSGVINKDNFDNIINICDGVVLGKKSTDISFIKELILK